MDCQKYLPHCRHVYRFNIKWHNQGKNEKKKKKKMQSPVYPKKKHKALKQLAKRKDIITNADKGSIVVIIDVEIISKQTENWLINTTLRHYKYTQLYNTISWLMTQSRELKRNFTFQGNGRKNTKILHFTQNTEKKLLWRGWE